MITQTIMIIISSLLLPASSSADFSGLTPDLSRIAETPKNNVAKTTRAMMK